ncbi:alpha/beta hydrolase family protein [Porphyrobacter sp. TH134]|uniref:alpha/beta hydrolase family protein n=1 Tax=Porphyrobacter sp. TH134 TaxID=2067450 RepID=UPI00155493CA|nr:dienelactone hydrolase family protein [Porphyrobacter sp. TH134]
MCVALPLSAGDRPEELAQSNPPARLPYAVPAPDAPALAALGSFAVGTQMLAIDAPDRVLLASTGVSRGVRTIKARIWYPSDAAAHAPRTAFGHALPKRGGAGEQFIIPSLAAEGALPIKAQRFPLVVVSHGYGGWDTFMTWLSENLATKGYVVVAIDHADQRVSDPAEFPVSFGNVLINRAADIRAVITALTSRAADASDPIGSVMDAGNIGLVGYSMGGFGVLGASGLDYDMASPVMAQLPAPAQSAILESQASGKPIAERIKGVVALAPFGGSPATRVWSQPALAAYAKPLLIIGGEHDDVVDTKNGVSWIFEGMMRNQRHFLLFQNARHNIGGNPPPPEADGDFSTREYFAEPVWRTERINAINQHFITAFLDLHLKRDEGKRAYLDVTPQVAGDGQWPLAPLQNVGGTPASASEPGHWRGFQRRWALGLEMKIGQPATQ